MKYDIALLGQDALVLPQHDPDVGIADVRREEAENLLGERFHPVRPSSALTTAIRAPASVTDRIEPRKPILKKWTRT